MCKKKISTKNTISFVIMENNKDHKSIFKEWLEKLQQESWQLELLISGFAIFGIYAARTTIKNLEIFQEMYLFDETGRLASTFILVLQKGWWIFFINLIFHVILRGLWIGAIGLRYVSGEINYDQFKYSDKVTQFLKNKVGGYDDFIENLERLCSVIFAYTFLLFLLFFSMMIFFVQVGFIGVIGQKILGTDSNSMQALSLTIGLYMILGFVVFIDLVTLGGFKRVKEKHIAAVYYYIYRFYSAVTFSFLYRPLLYNFIDHPYTKKLFYLSIPYIALILLGPAAFRNNTTPYIPREENLEQNGLLVDDYYYDDLRNMLLQEHPNEERKINKKLMPDVSLEQFRVTQSTSSLFIKLSDEYNDLLENVAEKKPFYKKGIQFSQFNLNHEKIGQIEVFQKEKSKQRTPLILKRQEINKKLKAAPGNQALISQKEQINRELDKLDEFWKDTMDAVIRKTAQSSIDDFLQYVQVSIDSQKIQLDYKNCMYYRHPHLGEMGIRCFFPTDSLSKGLHQLDFRTKEYKKPKDTTEKKLLLPFIKE